MYAFIYLWIQDLQSGITTTNKINLIEINESGENVKHDFVRTSNVQGTQADINEKNESFENNILCDNVRADVRTDVSNSDNKNNENNDDNNENDDKDDMHCDNINSNSDAHINIIEKNGIYNQITEKIQKKNWLKKNEKGVMKGGQNYAKKYDEFKKRKITNLGVSTDAERTAEIESDDVEREGMNNGDGEGEVTENGVVAGLIGGQGESQGEGQGQMQVEGSGVMGSGSRRESGSGSALTDTNEEEEEEEDEEEEEEDEEGEGEGGEGEEVSFETDYSDEDEENINVIEDDPHNHDNVKNVHRENSDGNANRNDYNDEECDNDDNDDGNDNSHVISHDDRNHDDNDNDNEDDDEESEEEEGEEEEEEEEDSFDDRTPVKNIKNK